MDLRCYPILISYSVQTFSFFKLQFVPIDSVATLSRQPIHFSHVLYIHKLLDKLIASNDHSVKWENGDSISK